MSIQSSDQVKRGKFITVEGIDGAGKSAIIDTIVSAVTENGIEIVTTREPGGTHVGEQLRELILCREVTITADTEILIIFAARSQHLEEIIFPNLKAGRWVLCDRFTDSTYAYQGGGREIPFERIQVIEDWLQKGFRPDLTLLLDTDVETGRERVRVESVPDRFEAETKKFHKRVRKAYQLIAKSNSERIKYIDAVQAVEEVCKDVRLQIEKFLMQNHG